MTDRIRAHLESRFTGAPKTRYVEETKQELLANCLDKYADLVSGGLSPESAYSEVVDGIGDVSELLWQIEQRGTFAPLPAQKNRMLGLASSTLWCLISAAYFIMSFIFFNWETSWVIFLFGGAAQCVLAAHFSPRRAGGLYIGAFWCIVPAVYILISFATFAWHITWIIFPLAVALQQALRFYLAWQEES